MIIYIGFFASSIKLPRLQYPTYIARCFYSTHSVSIVHEVGSNVLKLKAKLLGREPLLPQSATRVLGHTLPEVLPPQVFLEAVQISCQIDGERVKLGISTGKAYSVLQPSYQTRPLLL